MKCINCGNYVTKQENFCSRCGNKVNKLFFVRVLVLAIIAAVLFFFGARLVEEAYHFFIFFGVYVVLTIVVEFTLKVHTKKEALMSSILSPLFEFGFSMIFVVLFGMNDQSDAGGVALLGTLILHIAYVPALFLINFIISFIFGGKKKS